jgi:hypothetical protein
MASSGMLRRLPLVRTDVSEELSASFIRMTRMGELGTTLAVTSSRSTMRRFLQEPHGVTFNKMEFFKFRLKLAYKMQKKKGGAHAKFHLVRVLKKFK